jgi:hypothetical protein
MNIEFWKDIPEYEGHYQVSSFGNVRSLNTGKNLSPNKMNHGYTCVHLYKNGRKTRKVKTIHQLVATAFIPNPQELREVNHKNFIKHDNRLDNLEWVSRQQNVRHALDAGRRVMPEKKVKGIHLGTGKIVAFESQIAAEEALRGSRTGGISHAMKVNRPAYGYVWWFE